MFYAFYHRYGTGITDEHGKHIGHVEWFRTRADRDEYVSDNRKTEPIDQKLARQCLIDELRALTFDEVCDTRYMTMNEIVERVYEARIESSSWGY